MYNISDSDLQKIIDLSVNVGAIYLQWTLHSEELTTKEVREKFVCGEELLKILDSFDPKGEKKLERKRLAVLAHGYLREHISENHANLYRIGFSVVQQTVGLVALQSLEEVEDLGKAINERLPEHMENLKGRIDGLLPPNTILSVIGRITQKIEDEGVDLDIGDLLAEVFNEVVSTGGAREVTVTIGEESKTFQTFAEMVGALLNFGVEKFTKRCKSLNDFSDKEAFREVIEDCTNGFLSKNGDTLNLHKNDFISELNPGGKGDVPSPAPTIEELLFGAIGGMAEGFWLSHTKQQDGG
ncbi:MAG: hypothetical protein D8M57_06485 [Candidatus Scalindua sp. AMX11]|nr:MAG: hypothetical protein DWQ00_13910 [Candidatus Scalindua sp.]NOG85388.1 hypothetical protein [Planctomycetota bacterium]RZV83986.1 MAG: hypothetical protein EX341_08610 [Candidatus Scalindua sp. SCAELEC01]TDE65729.1 MAG: hypothetical protein D8M57_06485 [Candidatus Scalindua sp. AMX11]GJQ59666.1 MAG: hypothetical protein SCALA701_24670 [Candidatus Scalindua sp.]